jgi:hypothetical protein
MSGSETARRMWRDLETLHMTVYFAPEPRDAYRRAGLRGGWMGYFASRSAAMGPVPAEVVVATFCNFHPRMVHRAIPDAWGFATRPGGPCSPPTPPSPGRPPPASPARSCASTAAGPRTTGPPPPPGCGTGAGSRRTAP